jgi:hypothetical protein
VRRLPQMYRNGYNSGHKLPILGTVMLILGISCGTVGIIGKPDSSQRYPWCVHGETKAGHFSFCADSLSLCERVQKGTHMHGYRVGVKEVSKCYPEDE